MKRTLGVILVTCVILLSLSLNYLLASENNESLAPDFELISIEGDKVKLSDFRGKLVLLNFWAPWCPPCREEMPSLEAVYQRYKEKGLEVVAVTVQTFWVEREKWEISFPILLDHRGEAAGKYRVSVIPMTFLISPQGKIIEKFIGYRDWTDAEIIKLIEENLPQLPDKWDSDSSD